MFAIIYTAVETYNLNCAYNIIYLKFFVVYNQLKVYHPTLLKKVELIETIFTDFTEETFNDLKKTSKLLKIKLNSETISSANTGSYREKLIITTTNKTGDQASAFSSATKLESSLTNEGSIFKRYSNKSLNKDMVKNDGLQAEKSGVNSVLNKVIAGYKEKVKIRKDDGFIQAHSKDDPNNFINDKDINYNLSETNIFCAVKEYRKTVEEFFNSLIINLKKIHLFEEGQILKMPGPVGMPLYNHHVIFTGKLISI